MILTYLDRSKRLFQYVTNVRSDRGVCGVLFPDIGGGVVGRALHTCSPAAPAVGSRQRPAATLWSSPGPRQSLCPVVSSPSSSGGQGREGPGRTPGVESRLAPKGTSRGAVTGAEQPALPVSHAGCWTHVLGASLASEPAPYCRPPRGCPRPSGRPDSCSPGICRERRFCSYRNS